MSEFPRSYCHGHEEFKELVTTWFAHIERFLKLEIEVIRAEVTEVRSLVDTLKQNQEKHEDRVEDMHGKVEHIRGRLNGSDHHRDGDTLNSQHKRKTDTIWGRIKDDWLFLLVAVLAAIAGERALTEIKEIILEFIHHSGS